MPYFKDWVKSEPGNPLGYIPVTRLTEILSALPAGCFISTGFNDMPVMTVFDADMNQIGIIEPHRERFVLFEDVTS